MKKLMGKKLVITLGVGIVVGFTSMPLLKAMARDREPLEVMAWGQFNCFGSVFEFKINTKTKRCTGIVSLEVAKWHKENDAFSTDFYETEKEFLPKFFSEETDLTQNQITRPLKEIELGIVSAFIEKKEELLKVYKYEYYEYMEGRKPNLIIKSIKEEHRLYADAQSLTCSCILDFIVDEHGRLKKESND